MSEKLESVIKHVPYVLLGSMSVLLDSKEGRFFWFPLCGAVLLIRLINAWIGLRRSNQTAKKVKKGV